MLLAGFCSNGTMARNFFPSAETTQRLRATALRRTSKSAWEIPGTIAPPFSPMSTAMIFAGGVLLVALRPKQEVAQRLTAP